MSFNGAHSFIINELNQVDMSTQGNFEMRSLVDAACPGAGHESAERADPPRCHPDTRKKVIQDIMNWVNSEDPEKPLMWFKGVAGAGKSAIAQTIAERSFREGKLLSSFFFSRTATGSGRNDGSRLVPTIAYHLAIAIPDAKDMIIAELEQDPAMFHHSMEVQLKRLIMDPIEQLRNIQREASIPYLVIIDGLDECNELQVQSRIITTIADTLRQSPVHMQYLIVSRPEREIQKTFDLPSLHNVYVQLSVKDDSKAYHDIEVYLKSEFDKMKKTHTLATYLSTNSNWPLDMDIWTLVNRSSGQFIYASTVMKYIAKDDGDPESMENMSDENPFAQLDALCNYILSSAVSKTKGGKDTILTILQVILLSKIDSANDIKLFTATTVANFLGIKKSDLELWMVHLHSIISVPDDNGQITFHHASITDFLLDPSRSGVFFIDSIKGNIFMAQHCLAIIQHIMKPRTVNAVVIIRNEINIKEHEIHEEVQKYALYRYFYHMLNSNFDDELLNEFFELQDVGIVNFMIHERPHIVSIIKPLFNFDFHEKNFAVPKSEKAQDICRHVSNIVDKYFLEKYSNTVETYVKALNIMIQEINQESISSWSEFMYEQDECIIKNECWLAAIMDCPVRGKHLYLSNNKSQFLILLILEQLCKVTKPSLEFGTSLHKILLALEIHVAEFYMRELRIWHWVLGSMGVIMEVLQDYLLQYYLFSERENDSDRNFKSLDISQLTERHKTRNTKEPMNAAKGLIWNRAYNYWESDLELANLLPVEVRNEVAQGLLPDTGSNLEVDEEVDEEDHHSANISNISTKDTDQNSQPQEARQDVQHQVLDNDHSLSMEREADKLVDNNHITSTEVNKQLIKTVEDIDVVLNPWGEHLPDSIADVNSDAWANHTHKYEWLPVNEMGSYEMWAETSTNPEADNRETYNPDFCDINNENPWLEHVGGSSYFKLAPQNIQQLLPEHNSH
ncbi:hypothetical protein BDQ17DRAFT_1364570 [Cyathus striatus]|nr:hypothetical protein BDQ17DRAFT_1364570 [Cyathus striatus]